MDNPTFCIEDWPVGTGAGRQRLRRLRASHCIVPLPAFDKNGLIVAPADYKRHLEGATLWVEFSMHHKSVEARHEFTGRIRKIYIIQDAAPRVVDGEDEVLQAVDHRVMV